MTIEFNQYAAPLAFGFVQGIVYAVLLWIRSFQRGRMSDILLGLVLLAGCSYILDYLLGFMGIHILYNELLFFPRDLGLLIGPFYYFYLKSQINTSFHFSKKDIWHCLPFAFKVTYQLIIFSRGHNFVTHWVDTVHQHLYIEQIETVILVLSQYGYLFVSLRLYRQYKQWVLTQFSNTGPVSFRWYRNFLMALVIAITLVWLSDLIGLWITFSYQYHWWAKLVVVFLIYYVSIAGYSHPQPVKLVFENKLEEEYKAPRLEIPENGFNRWGLKIDNLMRHEKLYLNANLTLSDMASHLKTHNSLLSAVINQRYGKNFNDFVNEYRIKEFQARIHLPENKNLTILSIALDCGFNSKATFNRSFKKFVGQSPKEFINNSQSTNS